MGEHLPCKQKVVGSTPTSSTIYGFVVQLVRTLEVARSSRVRVAKFAELAQLVEPLTCNE